MDGTIVQDHILAPDLTLNQTQLSNKYNTLTLNKSPSLISRSVAHILPYKLAAGETVSSWVCPVCWSWVPPGPDQAAQTHLRVSGLTVAKLQGGRD